MEGYIWLLFEIQIFACGRTAGRVGEYNATGGPNSSAEAELRLAELVSWVNVALFIVQKKEALLK